MGPSLKSLRFNLPIAACILTLLSASSAIGADSQVAVDAAKLPGAGGTIQTHGLSFNSSVPFFIKGLANKCIDAGPPELRQLGRVVNLWDCNNSSAQQIDIDEVVPERHEVVLRAGPFCIGPQGGVRNVGVRLELQTCNPTAVEQRFAIDGDSIISLAGPPPNSLVRDRLVIEQERARTMRGTSLVLDERDFDDSEFWTFTPVIPPPENAPPNALQAQWPTLPSRQKPTTGFRIVRSEAELRALLPGNPPAPAPGLVLEVVANIELSAGAIVIPAGVTIRGGRGGFQAGSEISAPSNFAIRDPLFIVQGDNVRITGLRIRGPSNSTDSGNPKVDGIRILEDSSQPLFRTFIDHNELSNFTHAAIVGEGSDPDNAFCLPPADYHLTRAKIHVLRNFIHHNRRQGEGYGAEVGSGASALIQGNTFENNRHAIAATYDAGNEYYAYGNLVMPPAPLQQNLGVTWHTHDFDVHGVQAGVGFDFEDGWVPPHAGGTAGKYFDIAGNTFLGDNRENLDLRGTPCLGARFYNNVSRRSRGDAVTDRSYGNVLVVWGNQFGVSDPMSTLGTGDFDGDGIQDTFLATGAAWYYRPGGILEWRFLRSSDQKLNQLTLSDVDGDGRTDVVYRAGPWIMASWGAISPGDKIGEEPLPPQEDPPEPEVPPNGQPL